MGTERGLEEIAERFRRQSATAAPRAPLYVAVCRIVAADRRLAGLLLHAPGTQRLPVLFLAAVHAVLLGNTSAELAQWYPNLSDEPRSPTTEAAALAAAFVDFCTEHGDEITDLIATRSTQTNEVGRCALLIPVLAQIAREAGPVAHLDVGASAGLNLLWPQYAYSYQPGGSVGGPSPVDLECGTRGSVPVPMVLPEQAAALGLDPRPVDVHDDAQTRWLEACVWPDQADRFERLRAALALARVDPPEVRTGDGVGDLAATVGEMAARGHPVVTNSWVLNYFTAEQRHAYASELERFGADTDVSWIFLEAPELVPELPVDAVLEDPARRSMSVLTLVRWRAGRRSVAHLATCHPHGYWMHWHAAPPTATADPRPR